MKRVFDRLKVLLRREDADIKDLSQEMGSILQRRNLNGAEDNAEGI